MAFNPDDFQFEKILPPEEHKPIVEWDALSRLMLVRVKQAGEWTYQATQLTPQVNSNLLDGLPDEWSNDNDRVVAFAVYEDGDYTFIKEKLKFDFDTKKSKRIRYEYDNLEDSQVQEFFNILKAALTVQNVDSDVVKSRELIDLATTQEYLDSVSQEKNNNLNTLLRSTDWTQLADAVDTFDGEIELWSKYRQYLRDNTKTPADFDDLLDFLIWDEEFRWPIDPFTYHKKDPDHTVEYLTVDDHFSFSVVGSGVYNTEQIVGDLGYAARIAKNLQENGVPINKQMWDKIQQYGLNKDLTGALPDNLNIQ